MAELGKCTHIKKDNRCTNHGCGRRQKIDGVWFCNVEGMIPNVMKEYRADQPIDEYDPMMNNGSYL